MKNNKISAISFSKIRPLRGLKGVREVKMENDISRSDFFKT